MGKPSKRVSRRDFLRLAGLGAGAGIAAPTLSSANKPAAVMGAKRFSDPAGRPARPWWVKRVDEPTTEVDWSKVQRYNERTGTVRGPGFASYVGDEENDRLGEIRNRLTFERIRDNVPGYTLKDYGLGAMMGQSLGTSFLGPQKAQTPEERGVPKWTGTPEEAALLLFVGACVILIAGIVVADLEQGDPIIGSGAFGLTPTAHPTQAAGETAPREHRQPTPTDVIPTDDPEIYDPGKDATDDE